MRVIAALVLLAVSGSLSAQQIQAPTRVTPYDWQCQDKDGNKLSDHQRVELAYVACLNNAAGAFVQGGRYRVNRPTACPAKPADETQSATCPAGFTGNWTQTRSYTSAPAPTCWTPGEWTPATPPDGACTPVPTPDTTKPTTPTNLRAVAVSSSAVTWTWDAATDNVGVTGYWLGCCTGASCTTVEPPSPRTKPANDRSYTWSGLSPSTTYRCRVRAVDAANNAGGLTPYVGATTPAAPPPPAGTGTATIGWTPPTTNSDGSPLTDLAGYRIYYGSSLDNITASVDVPNPAITAHVVTGLAAGTWVFYVLAIDQDGNASIPSNTASKTIT